MLHLLPLMAEGYRLQLLRGVERLLALDGYRLIAGVDEAGRGCLAGPVVAAAVVVDPTCLVPGVDDSKRLLPGERERVAPFIRRAAAAFSVARVEAVIVDRINVLEATRLAMITALRSLDVDPDCALVDAVPLPGLRYPILPLVRGDALCFAVACASILAKTERDRIMTDYDRSYPEYGFARHKGYAAPEHLEALRRLGPTPIHRLTFRSVLPRPGDSILGRPDNGPRCDSHAPSGRQPAEGLAS